MSPSQQKVLYLTKKHGSFEVHTANVLKPGPGQILVKVEATALNPVDWKIQKYDIYVKEYPAILGADAAGTVEELGEGVTGFAKGDRVVAQGVLGSSDSSTFQQYTVLNADVTAKIPDNLSFDQAATIPLGLATAAIGLFNEENKNGSAALYPPWKDGGLGKYSSEPIFILGGASSVGKFALQLARLSGFNAIITTASPHNEAALKELGATHVIDRSLPADTIIAEVKKITGGAPVKTVYDAVSYADTQNLGHDVLAPGGTEVIDLLPEIKEEKKSADKKVVVVYGNVNFPDSRKLGVSLYAKLSQWLADGTLRPNNVEVLPNGLTGIISGLQRLEKGVSNVKLVVHPQETQ
ncbi:chaperonin 10-like protein [Fomitopsis betulina]|nr:chaperonin 10-like protein [Fomitopsis betulina]